MKKLSVKTIKIAFKSLFLLIFCITFQNLYSQNFDYTRVWGTYFGPAGTDLENSFIIDPQNNLHITGKVKTQSSLGAAYYNQYVSTGGQLINLGYNNNLLYSKFTYDGASLFREYRGGSNLGTNGITMSDFLVHIDGSGNQYFLKISNTTIAETGSSGVWFMNDPVSVSASLHSFLVKKSAAGTVIWKTFLPFSVNTLYYKSFVTDENDNLYICGNTLVEQNIGTAGVFRQNFQLYVENGDILENSFVAKIGSQGQLLWGSYLPCRGSNNMIEYHNQVLYMLAGGDINHSQQQIATLNTWQSNPDKQSLTAIHAANGTRIWGTYIGSGLPLSSGSASSVKVNSTGVYLAGIDFNTDSANYFATSGAYKSQVTGLSDYFITKLSLDGNRVWGTYFGSDGSEVLIGHNSLALTDQSLFFAGSTFGGGSNIATPGAFQSSLPVSNSGQSNNFFFTKFSLSGNLNWSSYYGGENYLLDTPQVISIFAPDSSTFYLVGSTRSSMGIAAGDAWQPQLPANLGIANTGFIARFNYDGNLSTQTSVKENTEISLYDNPNDGNFRLKGKVFLKENLFLIITDASGRKVFEKVLPKEETVFVTLKDKLAAGMYFVNISAENNKIIKTIKMSVRK